MAHNDSPSRPQIKTLSDWARYHTRGLTTRLGAQIHALGIHPDTITAVGLIVVAVAAVVVSRGDFFWAAIILLVGAPLDALDGAVARAMQRKGQFGALFDSTLDRYADGFIFMGLAVYFSDQGDRIGLLLALLALLGSLMVSYVRARAEGLDLECKVGLLTRMERMVIILAMLLTGWIVPGLVILVVGTHFTAMQRVWHVYRTLKRQEEDSA
ncbi:MAG: CDP-alcohol phosphatidyltransferase family protein [Anaerolineae bacterium]|nr:CDP-alcohol phosphatidyltransferase family protein [Anaerolineae bacterium]